MPPLGNLIARPHVVIKGKDEGGGGCKAKVIIKGATTVKGAKGDKQYSVTGQTSNSEEPATKV